MTQNSILNVVVVGGGYAGIGIWNDLSTHLDSNKHNLVLVTKRPYFTHVTATSRLVVTPEGKLEDALLLPFPASKFNTGNKKLIVASVTAIIEREGGSGYVVLDNGDQLEYSILVLATGTLWEGPLSLPNTKAETVDVITSWRARFQKANDIVIVGGGAIGLEMAGEIKDLGSSKNITIVQGQSLPLNDIYPQHWREYVAKQWRSRGITLLLGDYVDDPTIAEGTVTTRSGKHIPADLVIQTRGGRLNTQFLESLGDVLTTSGAVKVFPTLQVVGHPRIFAAGDIIAWNEQRQGGAKAPNHARVVARNIRVLLGLEDKPMIEYKGSPELIILTNGKNSGTGYLGVLWGITIGPWLSVLIKSRSLLVWLANSKLGLP